MTEPRVGWYVHHHGQGHLTRMLAVRPHLDAHVTVFSSLRAPVVLPSRTDWVELPRDDGPERRGDAELDPARSEPTAGGRLHWAPLHHRGHRGRLGQIATGATELDGFVVDVSAEVTALVRLLGLPVAIFTQPGDRVDPAHRLAFDLATAIICPWPAGLHDLGHVGGGPGRVHEVGWISRYAGRDAGAPTPGTVLLLGGIGEEGERPAVWAELHERFPHLRFTSAGYLEGTAVPDPWIALTVAEVVVSAAGQNSVADVIAARRRLVLVPQPRPFDEQWATARALRRRAAAAVLDRWPDPDALAAAITEPLPGRSWSESTELDSGAERAARVIEAGLS